MLAKNEQSTVCTQQALTKVAKVYEAREVFSGSFEVKRFRVFQLGIFQVKV